LLTLLVVLFIFGQLAKVAISGHGGLFFRAGILREITVIPALFKIPDNPQSVKYSMESLIHQTDTIVNYWIGPL
jgi:hypothetical protein